MSSEIFRLDYTGDDVNAAIAKIQTIDSSGGGTGVTEIESSVDTTYNLNFLRTVGLYRIDYVYDLTAPENASKCTPVYVTVSNVDDDDLDAGGLNQMIEWSGYTWWRISKDKGVTWGEWFDQSGDGLEPVEMTAEDVDDVFNAVLNGTWNFS